MWNIFVKDEKGFTGLEAAIVLIAFVVVAAVFSYVMLGAGFFTTQKSQEVVHTGVTQASSSVELSGDVISRGSVANNNLTDVSLFLQLTSGGSSVDINRTLIVYTSPRTSPKDLTNGTNATVNNFQVVRIYNSATVVPNYLVEKGEMFEILIQINALDNVSPNRDFQIEIKPPQGATYTIHRRAPPAISAIMTLV
jgi:archaeal flagellin FlaB